MKTNNKIPKRIHYCWFGHGEKPKKIAMCMKSWDKYLSDYEFIEWNEKNFDVHSNLFVKQAYEAKKYAFVSDYVRLYALYHYGGIYLDTDVEVIKPLDRFLSHEAFSGFEDENYLQSGTMGAVKNHIWIAGLLSYYDNRTFILLDGSYDTTSNTSIITKACKEQGLIANGTFQILGGVVTFYPRTFFSPYDYINGQSFVSEDSCTIHHFAKSWLPASVRWRGEIKRVVSRYLGPGVIQKLRTIIWKSSS